MGQQLGIVVLIDIPAAVESNSLAGNIWLVDNGGWDGSTGEGSPDLVCAIDVTDAQLDPGNAVLNWIPIGIGTIPINIPQTFFLYDDDRRALAQRPLPALHQGIFPVRIRNLVGDEVNIKHPGHLLKEAPRADPQMLLSAQGFVDPGTARFKRTGESRVAQPGDQDLVYYPDPAILRIHGEALDAGVIYPAQYGSPEMFSRGLYWSASVNPNLLGLYRYTIEIALYYSRRDADGRVVDDWVILSHDAWIKISTGAPRNGFPAVTLDLVSNDAGAQGA
ncbi:hypothetical protein [Sphingomonas kyeonggiensis]|uniref:Uncharacterized protein n=1 Tax=Sphingomonas kyeonggiensis TaxID=1268553 RepID=A0A7W6NY80_9SPHN|nr:hypothetical protein [Sphingomonas kyeonggiensis]MBB4100417.1 hypothetical protein [Sphingomonas kyeonggiensis]